MAKPMALDDEGPDPYQAWKERGIAWVKARCETGESFTADDLHEALGEPPHPNHWGALWKNRDVRELIESCGHERSRRPVRNHGHIHRWKPKPWWRRYERSKR